MGDLSKHLSRNEIACKCGCGFDDLDEETVRLFEEVRWMNGDVPIKPSSGCRCPGHNKAEGGSDKSKHMIGTAIDIPCRDPNYIYNYLDTKYPRKYGLGLYSWGVHVDCRAERARW
jgi:uncharacterized protein YcbK (DUF882 family)